MFILVYDCTAKLIWKFCIVEEQHGATEGLESKPRFIPKLQANYSIIDKIILPAKCQCISLQNIVARLEVVYCREYPPTPPSCLKAEKRYGLNRLIHVKSLGCFALDFWDRPVISCQRHFTCQSSKLVCMSHSFLGEALTPSDCHFSLLKAGNECPFVWFLTSTLRCSGTSPRATTHTHTNWFIPCEKSYNANIAVYSTNYWMQSRWKCTTSGPAMPLKSTKNIRVRKLEYLCDPYWCVLTHFDFYRHYRHWL